MASGYHRHGVSLMQNFLGGLAMAGAAFGIGGVLAFATVALVY